MTRWAEYLTAVATNSGDSYRRGQKMFNVLWEMEPEIANEIRGTDVDPFNDDSKIGDFLKEIYQRMEEQ